MEKSFFNKLDELALLNAAALSVILSHFTACTAGLLILNNAYNSLRLFFLKNKQKTTTTHQPTKPQPAGASLNRVFLYASKKFGHFSLMSFWPCLCPSAGWGEEIPKEGQMEIFPIAGAVWLSQHIGWDKPKPYQPFWGWRNSVLEYPVKRKVFWFPFKVQIPPVDVFLSRQKSLRKKKKIACQNSPAGSCC